MKKKPLNRLTVEDALARAQTKYLEPICAGQSLALQWHLDRWEMTAVTLARSLNLGVSTIYDVLAVQYSPSSNWWSKVARCFGLELHEFDKHAALILRGEIPV